MPETVTEKGVAPQAQEAREKSQAAPASEPKRSAHDGGAHGGAYTLFRELTAASGAQEPPPDKLSPIFRKSEFSHPVKRGMNISVVALGNIVECEPIGGHEIDVGRWALGVRCWTFRAGSFSSSDFIVLFRRTNHERRDRLPRLLGQRKSVAGVYWSVTL